jgi:mono/diheme cytochrome c family protein
MTVLSLIRPAVAAAAVLLVTATFAQESGDAARGLKLAKANCAGCHGIDISDDRSPLAKAPPFKQVAVTPGMSEYALMVWFRSPHKSMPDFIVATTDVRDLAAYILSLKAKAQ